MVPVGSRRGHLHGSRLLQAVWPATRDRWGSRQACPAEAVRDLTDVEEPQFAAGAAVAVPGHRPRGVGVVGVENLGRRLTGRAGLAYPARGRSSGGRGDEREYVATMFPP